MMRLQLQQLIPKWIVIVLIVVAFLGFADATFLTVEHYRNTIPPCTTSGCETVLTSAYATIVGIPVALVGSVYYLLIAILLITYLDIKKELVLRTALTLTTIGFVASIFFFILQAFVIHAFCQYCLVSALTSTTLFAISVWTMCKYRDRSIGNPSGQLQ